MTILTRVLQRIPIHREFRFARAPACHPPHWPLHHCRRRREPSTHAVVASALAPLSNREHHAEIPIA